MRGKADEKILDPLHARPGDGIAHLGDDRRQPLEAPSTATSVGRFAQAAGKFVAGKHHVRDAAHHAIEQFDRKADGARSDDALALAFGDGGGDRRAGVFGARLQACDQRAVVAGREYLTGFERRDHFGDAVDDGQNRADQRSIGVAAASADFGKRILGGVAERFKPRKIEEAAIALHGVDEAKNGIEPGAVVGRGLPSDDLTAQSLEHLAAFGNEIGNQIVHRRAVPQP